MGCALLGLANRGLVWGKNTADKGRTGTKNEGVNSGVEGQRSWQTLVFIHCLLCSIHYGQLQTVWWQICSFRRLHICNSPNPLFPSSSRASSLIYACSLDFVSHIYPHPNPSYLRIQLSKMTLSSTTQHRRGSLGTSHTPHGAAATSQAHSFTPAHAQFTPSPSWT